MHKILINNPKKEGQVIRLVTEKLRFEAVQEKAICLKVLLVLSVLPFASSSLFSQDFFPLHVGDKWQYGNWFSGNFGGYYNIEILVDSTMPNGKHYYFRNHLSEWLRIDDSLNTYVYDRFNSNQDSTTPEYLVDRFQDSTGQSWISYKDGGPVLAKIENVYETMLFSDLVTIKVISYYSGELWLSREYYSSKHGMVYLNTEGGAEYFMTGAIIDGISYGTIVSVKNNPYGQPLTFSLGQNYPNPFNPSTTISFSIPKRSIVTLMVYNLLGQEVRSLADSEFEVGEYSINFDASGLPSGTYIYRLVADHYIESKRMVLLK